MFTARITGGTLRGSQEGEARLYPQAALPAVSSKRIGSRKAIEAYLAKQDP